MPKYMINIENVLKQYLKRKHILNKDKSYGKFAISFVYF